MKLKDLRDFLAEPADFEVLYKGKRLHYLNEAGSFDADSSVFYVAGHEFGPHTLIHVTAYGQRDGFEPAYEAWIDSMPVCDETEVLEAYAPDDDSESFYDLAGDALDSERPKSGYGNFLYSGDAWEAWQAKRNALARTMLDEHVEKAREGTGDDYPHLIEGYRENSNGGVVDIGHYENMHEAEEGDIEFVRKCGHTDCEESAALADACREANHE